MLRNKKKLIDTGDFISEEHALQHLKGYIDDSGELVDGVFTKIFRDHADNIFNSIWDSPNSLKEDLFLDSDNLLNARIEFDQLLNDPSSILYSFITIQ